MLTINYIITNLFYINIVCADFRDFLYGNYYKNAHETFFFYFAYGSNMLEKRLHLNIPDATVYGPALYKRHRLDFTTEASWWNGAVATLCKDPSESAWGVVWTMSWSDKKKLDIQEGVHLGWYHTEDILVYSPEGDEIAAVTYIQNHNPRKLSPWENHPPERLPSATYLRVMILGAVQGGLPVEYIRYLYHLPHNGRKATQDVLKLLGSPFSDAKKNIDIKVYM